MYQLHKLFNHNNVKVSYGSLTNFKSVINGHNKNIFNKQEKCLHTTVGTKHNAHSKEVANIKNLVYSCKVSATDIKQNHQHYLGLTEHTFKDRLYKHNNSFKCNSKRN